MLKRTDLPESTFRDLYSVLFSNIKQGANGICTYMCNYGKVPEAKP